MQGLIDQDLPPPNGIDTETRNTVHSLHQQQGLNYMSQEEIKLARTAFGAIQLTTQPALADIDVQYGTIGTSVGESRCIGEDIE